MSNCCCGNEKVTLIYSCSGGADVGALADKVARKLSEKGIGTMSCIASVGAEISGFLTSARYADCNITIDGCGLRCAAKNLENRGVKPLSYILTELGLNKGKTDTSAASLNEAIEKITKQIQKKEKFKTKPVKRNSCGCGCSC